MELGNLNGLQLEFGEGGRLGKGGHMDKARKGRTHGQS